MTIWKRHRSRQLGVTNEHPSIQNRKFYTNVVPTSTIYNCSIPSSIHIRKFSPCGNYLLCFSKNQHAIQCYAYSPRSIRNEPAEVFASMFTLIYETNLTSGSELLCKDFCLFTQDNRHIILASAIQSGAIRQERRFPDSLTCIDSLDDITFWVIDTSTGTVCEKKHFTQEYTYLTGHAGVHLYKDTLAILSIQNQSVYMLKITENGKLEDYRTIGYHNYEDDAAVLSALEVLESQRKRVVKKPRRSGRVSAAARSGSIEVARASPKIADARLSGIKQRLMSFLFRRAHTSGDPAQLQHFCMVYDLFTKLVMWRVHFMDDDTILLKFGTVDNIMYRQNTEPITNQIVFFVVYSLQSTQVTGVYESSSPELFTLYNNSDNFRGNAFNENEFLPTTVSNNKYARDITEQHMYTVKKARNGGAIQAMKRVLATLPMNPQSFTPSPYFDHNIFHYDEKVITSLDRSRSCTNDFPLKFYERNTGKVSFFIESNATPQLPQPLGTNRHTKRTVTYIFHPSHPFIISTQSAPLQLPIVNFHVRL